MAGFNLGDIFVTFKAKMDGFKEAANGAKSTAGAVNDTINKTAGLGKQLVSFAAGVAGTFLSAKAAVDVFKNAADFEQTRIGLENMLGSADRARAVLAEVSEFAAKTPFEFPELASSVRQLVAFGFSAEDAVGTMKQLGDVSAAVGAPINDLSYLMGTLRTQGRAFTIDIRQFAQRGIPIYEYLAKVLKTNEQEISKMIEAGKIGFPEVQKAFQMMTAEGGKFHGAMEAQSKSISGMLSTLKDNLFAAGRAFLGLNEQGDIAAGSILDRLKGVVEGLNVALANAAPAAAFLAQKLIDLFSGLMQVFTAIASYLGPKLEQLWQTIQNNVIPLFMRFWNEVLAPLIPVIGTILVGALGLVIDTINILLPILTALGNWMVDNKPIVLALAVAVGVLWATMKAKDAINAFMDNFNLAKNAAQTAIGEMQGGKGLGGLMKSLTGFTGWAIFASAAIGALAAVIQKFDEMNQTIRNTQNALDANQKSNDTALKRMAQQYKEGKVSRQVYEAAIRQANEAVPSFATGVQNFAGGLAMVHKGEALVNMPRGTDVIPASQVGSAKVRGGDVHIHLDGANITSPHVADMYGELIGDSIIKRLMAQTRL